MMEYLTRLGPIGVIFLAISPAWLYAMTLVFGQEPVIAAIKAVWSSM